MDLPNVVQVMYLAIALMIAVMTYQEQRATARRPWPYNVIGLLACLLWPLVVVAILATPRAKVDYS